MKIYKLNSNPYEEMDLEEAMDWLQLNCHFTLNHTENVEENTNQNEMINVLIDAYFIIEEIDNGDSWENDTEEREKEYRREQL